MSSKLFLLASIGFVLVAAPVAIVNADTPSTTVVAPAKARSDTAVQNDLVSALKTDPTYGKYSIDARVKHGMVHLKGTVDSAAVKSGIESKVAGVPGVKKVVNEILVKNPEATK